MKYKVLQEYDRYYLGENEKGFKECFLKSEYKPTEEGYIIKKTVNDQLEEIELTVQENNNYFKKKLEESINNN